MGYLLDTNIVSAIFKNNQKVIIQLDNLRTQKEKVFMSAMTYYEIERGFLAVKATRKLLDLAYLTEAPRLTIPERGMNGA